MGWLRGGLGLVVGLVVAVLIVGLWGSRGHLPAFVAGQLDEGIPRPDPGVSQNPPDTAPLRVTVGVGDRTVRQTDPRYLSFAIDTSAVVGGKWWDPAAERTEVGTGSVEAPVFDFARPRLDALVSALTPAVLRIGGSEADKVFYAIDDPVTSPPEGFDSVLTREQWDGVNRFAARNGLDLVMTLNAGPASRDADGHWISDNAAGLVRYTVEQGYDVDVWELGNELNIFWFVHGLDEMVPADVYANDVDRLRSLVAAEDPGARVAGQSAAFWPVFGEPLGLFFGVQRPYAAAIGADTAYLGWHYYPQQSRRGPIASRRASETRLLNPDHLDEAAHWARFNAALRDAHAPGVPLWLGETGNAQFGGEPGVSDRYVGSLWWLDQLGLLARHDHDVVVRQTLAGSNYQLITADTLEPLPDYWASVLWKRLMGTEVLPVATEGSDRARVYAHRTPDGDRVTVLVINLDPERRLEVDGLALRDAEVRAPVAPDVFGTELWLDGRALAVGDDLVVPETPGTSLEGPLFVNPLSYAFVTGELP